MENIDNGTNIFVVRHGESYYQQTQCSVDAANDLTEKGIESSRQIAELIRVQSYVRRLKMLSSPYGRALHTAKVIIDTLHDRPHMSTIELSEKVEETRVGYFDVIEPISRLVKSQGFRWEYVNPLVVGGVVNFRETHIDVDSELTNPQRYDFHTYLVQDEMKKIPTEVKELWPREYVYFIEGVETFESVSKRMMETFEEIKNRGEVDTDYVVVTHGSLVGFLSYVYSGQFKEEIKTGELVTVRSKGGKYFIINAGTLVEGGELSKLDVFSAFRRHFGYDALSVKN